MSAPDRMCELFKALRGRWLTRLEISIELGYDLASVRNWLRELVDNGFVIERDGTSSNLRGVIPKQYTLAPEWGGQAA